MNTAAWQRKYLIVEASRSDLDGRPIALRSNVLIMGWEYMPTATLAQSYTSYLEQVLAFYATRKWQSHFSLQSVHALPAWTSPSMFEPQQARSIFALDWKLSVSDPGVKSVLGKAKRCTLVLPSLIGFAGSTATIHRIHALNYCELSLYLGEEWRRLQPPILSNRATRVHLQLEPETPGG